MAVKIRLSRIGAKKRPVYRIVVVDSRKKRDGRYIDLVGLYNPIPATPEIRIDDEKVFAWLKNGAKLSDTVKSIFRKQGILRKWAAIQSGQPIPQVETEVISEVEPGPISAAPEAEEPAVSPVEAEETSEASETESAEVEGSEEAEPAEG